MQALPDISQRFGRGIRKNVSLHWKRSASSQKLIQNLYRILVPDYWNPSIIYINIEPGLFTLDENGNSGELKKNSNVEVCPISF
jgi:hypothetical protein